MSLQACGERFELDIRPSRLIVTLLFSMHAIAAVICAQLPLPLPDRLVLLLAVLGSLGWNGVRFWRHTPKRLLWSAEEGWRIIDRNDATRMLELLPQAYLGTWLVMAHFRLSGNKRRTIMLARDSCSGGGLRRLRVLLRYGTPTR